MATQRNFDGVMLDGDGTLWMTEAVFIQGYTQVCADEGVDFAEFDYATIVGKPVVLVLTDIIAKRGLNRVPALMYKDWHDLVYGSLIQDVLMRDGADGLLDWFEDEKLPHMIVTNAPADHLMHVERVFPRVKRIPRITRDDPRVPKGCHKPDPLMFRLAAQDMRIDIGRALMIGDTMNDTKGGRDAGAYVIGTPHDHSSVAQLGDAHLILEDLRDFRPELIPMLPLGS